MKKVIKQVFRREEIYAGPLTEKARDLVLVSKHGFDLKVRLNTDQVSAKRLFTGKHTLDDAFLLVRTPNGTVPQNPTVFDVSNIILHS